METIILTIPRPDHSHWHCALIFQANWLAWQSPWSNDLAAAENAAYDHCEKEHWPEPTFEYTSTPCPELEGE